MKQIFPLFFGFISNGRYTPPLSSRSPTRANSNPILPPYLLPLPTYPPITHTPPIRPSTGGKI